MTNRYAGKCQQCGERVQAGEGVVEKQGRRWLVWHNACKDSDTPRNGAPVRRGRCEDAPCCGCCD